MQKASAELLSAVTNESWINKSLDVEFSYFFDTSWTFWPNSILFQGLENRFHDWILFQCRVGTLLTYPGHTCSLLASLDLLPSSISCSRLSTRATPKRRTNWICSIICHVMLCRVGSRRRISPNLRREDRNCRGGSKRAGRARNRSFIAGVSELGCIYPQRCYPSEGAHLKLATEEKNIFICYLLPDIYAYISEYYFHKSL